MNVNVYLENEAKLPKYQHEGDAGADVCSIMDDFILYSNERVMVHTGIYMDIPEGYECQCRPRSGLAINYGITVLNSPGTIDSKYKGECNVILINHSDMPFEIKKGMRIGQFVFNKYESVNFIKLNTKEEIGNSDRGSGGFGHSGTN